jgi:hypothetical protein
MGENKMNELQLVEQKEIREQYIERIDILDKVKTLLLLPDISLATIEQVASYYEVKIDAIVWHLRKNEDELKSDGYIVWKAEDFKNEFNSELKIYTNRGNFEIEFNSGQREKFSPRGVGLFTRRAILRIGMLLQDSKIAKEIRTQLLNIEEQTTIEQKIKSITEEQLLMIDIMSAPNEVNRMIAVSKYNEFKNRYINSLENEIDMLVTGILTWDTREAVNRMARKIAVRVFNSYYGKAWDKIYAEMLYKHNIGIVQRKNFSKLKRSTIFDVLNEEETKLLVKTCLSLCELYKIDISDLMMENKEIVLEENF